MTTDDEAAPKRAATLPVETRTSESRLTETMPAETLPTEARPANGSRPSYGRIWPTLALDGQDHDVAATLMPPTLAAWRAPDEAVPGADASRLELRGVIGEGGMGLVRSAVQRSLGREVAVKMLRPEPRPVDSSHPGRSDRSHEEATRTVLQEAFVTAVLEHPNIVPVYGLEMGERGAPHIVMRRIDGVRWSDCLRDPGLAPRLSHEDPLGWHLSIFLQVCNAVHYAHTRGLLHRDLKPENVMVGRFGDVYVLDWGLAVALDPRLAPRVPLASETHEVAGTPAYMAPEMAVGAAEALSPASDVYLLGATLHEIITGSPPHRGSSLFEVLQCAYESAPCAYGDEVPSLLRAICHRAMHFDPAERHPSVEDLRRDVERFLDRRPALALADQALKSLNELERAVATPGTADERGVHEIFGACRFAFSESLRIWPDNAEAAHDYARALRLMAGFEIERENAPSAERLLAELPAPDPDLDERLSALTERLARREQEYRELKRLEEDLDAGFGSRARSFIVLVFGLAVGLHNVWWGRSHSDFARSYESAIFLGGPVVVLTVLTLLALMLRHRVFRNRANRGILAVLWTLVVLVFAVRAASVVHQTPIEETYSYLGFVYAMAAAVVANLSDRRILWSAWVLAGGAVLSLVFRTRAVELAGVSIGAAMVVMALVWARPLMAESPRGPGPAGG